MVELRTEEQQVAALKRWWDTNGKSLLLGIIVAIAGVAFWHYYQDQQRTRAETASAYFQRMLSYTESPQLGVTERANIRQDARRLQEDFSDSIYAAYAALMLAKVSVQEQDLPQAESHLQWLLENTDIPELLALANVRLARVLLAQNRGDQALVLLVDQDDAWQARRLEVRGDVLLQQGNQDGARSAYTQAKQIASKQGINTALLNLKLDDLAQ